MDIKDTPIYQSWLPREIIDELVKYFDATNFFAGQLPTFHRYNLIDKYRDRVCTKMASHGYLSGLKSARSAGYPFTMKTRHDDDIVYHSNNVCVLGYYTIWVPDCGEYAMRKVALHGHLHILRWALSRESTHLRWARKNYVPISRLHFYAVKGDHLHILQWLDKYEDFTYMLSNNPLYHVQSKEVVDWLLARDIKIMHGDCKGIAERGNLPLLQYLHSKNATMCIGTMESAINHGHLDIAQWLFAIGRPILQLPSNIIPSESNIHVIRWLHNIDAPLLHRAVGNNIVVNAIKSGTPSIIEELLGMGFTCNEFKCSYAYKNNNLPTLQWLVDRGYPIDSKVCLEAICHNNLDMLTYGLNHGIEYEECMSHNAVKHHRHKIVKWLEDNGYN